jgi:hypothetical protein
MRRVHLLEIEDQPWCPAPVRDGSWTGCIYANRHKAFNAMARNSRNDRARGARDRRLCSGGGGPWLPWRRFSPRREAARSTSPFMHNVAALDRVSAESKDRITFCAEPVDANVRGTRRHAIFNAFHHFRPREAQAILADAVAQRRAIAIVRARLTACWACCSSC